MYTLYVRQAGWKNISGFRGVQDSWTAKKIRTLSYPKLRTPISWALKLPDVTIMISYLSVSTVFH